MSVEKTPGPQLWSKPLSDSKVAVLVLNTLKQPQSFSVPLADVPGLKCGAGCAVRDVWRQQDNGTVTGQLAMDLAPLAQAHVGQILALAEFAQLILAEGLALLLVVAPQRDPRQKV